MACDFEFMLYFGNWPVVIRISQRFRSTQSPPSSYRLFQMSYQWSDSGLSSLSNHSLMANDLGDHSLIGALGGPKKGDTAGFSKELNSL